ncbi:AAA family ATPase [Pseudanabaena sp. PCC 6802]|uniref:bifunctional aminoglycoside phosphotransferase/ATP-binding protein n=1 Tax=Pseudanabaena sp. PCC 6802 TaxID=118173 RepID=UPI0003464D7F|nr:bifunctional aminoglycoside phosphotransferase/ATP-binding protein [Pseudanabaena sp. PCC 6802]
MTANLPPLIQQMLSPDFYPHAVTQEIELIQTHISFVLLTGEYAYKVKKPMNFGFLDFSTLEKRLFFCQEEIRLNRRLAPELYLQVLPIVEQNGKFTFSTEKEPAVEYCIQMRQFPQSDLLINVFDRGELTPAHVEDIAKQLAKFHATADTNEHIASFGTREAVKAVADDNYQHTVKYIGLAQTQAQFDQTKAFSDKFFSDYADLFADRVAQGKVKECHGDVHLKNICLYQRKVQIFDCIEFNEPFRNSDTLYDAAFLLMDLQYRDRRDLANVFLNTYLEQTGDYDGVPLLPLYSSMRAYIRAKVTSFLLDDPGIPQPVKEQAQAEAAAYYKLAWQYTQSTQGKITIVSGLSGSGKSTTARGLAARLEALHIRSDAIRKHLAGIDLMQRGDDALYTPEMTAKTYARLAEIGMMLASKGFNVILDAKYDRINLRADIIERAEAQGIPWQILYCHADMTLLKQRLSDRVGDVADATADLVDSQVQQFETFTAMESVNLMQLDTTNTVDFVSLASNINSPKSNHA